MLYYRDPPFYFINRDDFACYEDAYNQYLETQDWEQYVQHVLSCPVSFEDSLHELPEEFDQELLTSDKGCYNTIPTSLLC